MSLAAFFDKARSALLARNAEASARRFAPADTAYSEPFGDLPHIEHLGFRQSDTTETATFAPESHPAPPPPGFNR